MCVETSKKRYNLNMAKQYITLKVYAIIDNHSKHFVSGDFGNGKLISTNKEYLQSYIDPLRNESIIEFTAKVEK
jgi:hypothetical protein